MIKIDIEDVFWIIFINFFDYYFLGFLWEGIFYFDKCLFMRVSVFVVCVNCLKSEVLYCNGLYR